MAKLIDAVQLIENPKNVPMFVECRGEHEFRFRVGKKYDEEKHCVSMIGGRVVYDIDDYNRKWRAWDELPMAKEPENTPWLPEEPR